VRAYTQRFTWSLAHLHPNCLDEEARIAAYVSHLLKPCRAPAYFDVGLRRTSLLAVQQAARLAELTEQHRIPLRVVIAPEPSTQAALVYALNDSVGAAPPAAHRSPRSFKLNSFAQGQLWKSNAEAVDEVRDVSGATIVEKPCAKRRK
jgi:hypothetical protein